MKKRMLFITRKFPPSVGGMENGMYQIAKNLPDDDLDVKVVSLGKKQAHLVWFFPYILLYTLFHAKKYDYLFLGDGVICLCGVIAKKINPDIRRIIILHGLDVSYSNPVYQKYIRLFLKPSADLFACNSHYTASLAEQLDITEKDGLHTVVHGIDSNKYAGVTVSDQAEFRRQYAIKESDMILLTSGRLVKRKGVEWFIRNVLTQIEGVTYLVVGGGEEKENIEAAVKETKMEEKVRLLGKVSDQVLYNCYFNADVFVMPNIHVKNDAEGFGLVALEASLAGTLVVASNIDGIPDAIINGCNGILVEKENPDAFIGVLQSIRNNPAQYHDMAVSYQKYTSENCSWVKTCSRIRELLRQ